MLHGFRQRTEVLIQFLDNLASEVPLDIQYHRIFSISGGID